MDVMTISIIAGLSIVAAGALFAAWKFGREGKNQSVIIGLAAIGPVVNAIKDFLPEDKEGIDATEIVASVANLAAKASEAITDPDNTTFDDNQDELVAFVKEELPRYGVENVSDGLINGVASAVFMLIKNYPTVVLQLKKLRAEVSKKTE